MAELVAYVARIIGLFTLVYVALRVSGKKNVTAMSAVDLMGVILIAAMASEPLLSDSAIKTVFGIGVVLSLQFILGRLGMVNALSPYIQQQPTVLVRQGQFDRQALLHVEMTVEQVLSEVRRKGYIAMGDVEYVVLEPSGQVSVIPKSTARPATPGDLGLSPPYDGLALPLVLDGAVIHPNLRYAGVTETWLKTQLKNHGLDHPQQAFLAELDSRGKLTIQPQPGRGGAFYGTRPFGDFTPTPPSPANPKGDGAG